MADRVEADRASQAHQPSDNAPHSEDVKAGLSPEGRQLLQLIKQDFSLLRSGLSNTLGAFIDYDDNEFGPPSPEEPITGADLEETIGMLREGVEGHIIGLDNLIARFEAEVNRLAEAFSHLAGPEGVRAQGYVRLLAKDRSDWEGPLLAERANPFGGDFWGERIARKDDPASVRVDGVQYMLREEHDHLPGFKGHGGRDFYIRFHDGRLVHTTNLWLNGPIPQE